MYPDRVLDMAYTLNQRREHCVYRTFCTVGDDRIMGKAAAIARVPTATPDLAMVFSGQGAQWPTMGKELILTSSEVRSDIEAMDRILQSLQYPPAWKIEGKKCFLRMLPAQIWLLPPLSHLPSSLHRYRMLANGCRRASQDANEPNSPCGISAAPMHRDSGSSCQRIAQISNTTNVCCRPFQR